MQEVFELDTIGMDCPLPLVKLRERVQTAQPGDEITLLFSCPEAVVNIPAWCKEQGHDVLAYEKIGGKGWKIVIRV